MDVKALYQKKVLNQELSLKEFAARKTVLESRPSKLQLQIGFMNSGPMSPALFENVAADLFGNAYFADFLGTDDAFAGGQGRFILSAMERSPGINWHAVVFLRLADAEVWEALSRLGTMFGVLIPAATKKSWRKIRTSAGLEFEDFSRNLETLGRAHARTGRGMLYLIARIEPETGAEFYEYVNLAVNSGVSEVVFKLQPSAIAEKVDRDSLVRALELAAERGMTVRLGDQKLASFVDPELILKTMKSPAYKLNFPPEGYYDAEFERLHSWRPLDAKVVDRGRISVYKKCFKPFHFVHVGIRGQVGPCNYLLDPFTGFGNLAGESFDSIWNGERYQKLRTSLLERNPEDPRCQWCFSNRLSD